jgi:hypothetical protein
MIPKWLKLEDRDKFQAYWDRAIQRYIKKYGREPGWQGRYHILGGLCRVFKVGCHTRGHQLSAYKKIRHNLDKWVADGNRICDYPWKEVFKPKPKKVTRIRRKVEEKRSWLQF